MTDETRNCLMFLYRVSYTNYSAESLNILYKSCLNMLKQMLKQMLLRSPNDKYIEQNEAVGTQ